MAERIKISIEPSNERGDSLTVQDAMLQVLDFIEVVTAAADESARPFLSWRLVSASKNSPFTAVAEAFSLEPNVESVDFEARSAKVRTVEAFRAAMKDGDLADWLQGPSQEKFRRLLRRNLNGIGRTDYGLVDEYPIIVVARIARTTLEKIERNKQIEDYAGSDLSGMELGSIEGVFLETTTHFGRPAIRIKDRLTGRAISCVLSEQVADEINRTLEFRDVWSSKRILVDGRISRNKEGQISGVRADRVTLIEAPEFSLKDAMDKNFTGGLPVRQYLDDLWGD